MNLRPLFLAVTSLFISACAVAGSDCPYLPEFKSLQKQLENLPALDAVVALQKFVLEHENPEGCEYAEIDSLLQEREVTLIRLAIGGGEKPAQVVYRCDEFDPTTAQCRSPMEDGTARPLSAGVVPMTSPPAGSAYRITSAIPASELVGIYQVTLSDALNGKPAVRIGKESTGKWNRPRRNTSVALMAVYKTQGPWAYRKAVWYFR
jgi:hypothetical protein